MCTGRGLIAGVARVRLPYAENPVGKHNGGLMKTDLAELYSITNLVDFAGQQTQRGLAFAWRQSRTRKGNRLFPGPVPHVSVQSPKSQYVGEYMISPCLRAGCAHAAWTGGGSRSDALGAGRRCLAPLVGGGRWSRAARERTVLGGGANAWASGGPDRSVSSSGAESDMRGRLCWCGVRCLFQGCCSCVSLGPSAHAA